MQKPFTEEKKKKKQTNEKTNKANKNGEREEEEKKSHLNVHDFLVFLAFCTQIESLTSY